jgi:hypothetical protein
LREVAEDFERDWRGEREDDLADQVDGQISQDSYAALQTEADGLRTDLAIAKERIKTLEALCDQMKPGWSTAGLIG